MLYFCLIACYLQCICTGSLFLLKYFAAMIEKIFLRDKYKKPNKVEVSVERFIYNVFQFCNVIVPFFIFVGWEGSFCNFKHLRGLIEISYFPTIWRTLAFCLQKDWLWWVGSEHRKVVMVNFLYYSEKFKLPSCERFSVY